MKFLSFTFLILCLTFHCAAQKQVTIYLAGDSTMAAKQADKRPETGWGEMLQQFFDATKIKVVNEAQNGRSTKSFIDEGRWRSIVDRLKKGDWVIIQFGHNDEKKDKPAVYAAPEDYKANLVRFVSDARAKGATPILMTPVARRKFENESLVKTHGEYPDAVKSVGKDQGVAVIDMESKSSSVLTRYGNEGSRALFLQLRMGESANYPRGIEDNTHFSPKGAKEMAALAVEGIRENKIKLNRYVKKK